MKNNINKILATIFLVGSLCGCSEFDQINTNRDNPTTVTAPMLATSMIYDIASKGFGGDKSFIYDTALAKQLAWWESAAALPEQYSKIGEEGMYFQIITNGKRMIQLADPEDRNAYMGLAMFAKVNKMFETSMKLGDIAYSEAGLAEEGLITPKYDTQKDVMIGLLNDIDQAYKYFSSATRAFKGDMVYNGDIEKWKKATTALELKILMHLSLKENDADLNVKKRFQDAIKKSLMTSNNDNFEIKFQDKAGMHYPFSSFKSAQQTYFMHSTTIIDTLKKYNDHRLFYYAEPAASEIAAGKTAQDKNAYLGVDPSAMFTNVSAAQKGGKFSRLNFRYTNDVERTGEPFHRFSYDEQLFILAEAALRGWIPGSASTYYKHGIEAHMKFVADNTLAKYNHGMPITATTIADFLSSTAIQLTGDFNSDLNKIMTQKYIASLLQFTYNAYFDYRRTKYPVLPINPASSQNYDGFKDQMPTRWRYRPAEYSSNRKNLDEALQRQYNGLDRNNDLMWILK